jgi:hypothetical protein
MTRFVLRSITTMKPDWPSRLSVPFSLLQPVARLRLPPFGGEVPAVGDRRLIDPAKAQNQRLALRQVGEGAVDQPLAGVLDDRQLGARGWSEVERRGKRAAGGREAVGGDGHIGGSIVGDRDAGETLSDFTGRRRPNRGRYRPA